MNHSIVRWSSCFFSFCYSPELDTTVWKPGNLDSDIKVTIEDGFLVRKGKLYQSDNVWSTLRTEQKFPVGDGLRVDFDILINVSEGRETKFTIIGDLILRSSFVFPLFPPPPLFVFCTIYIWFTMWWYRKRLVLFCPFFFILEVFCLVPRFPFWFS